LSVCAHVYVHMGIDEQAYTGTRMRVCVFGW